jgi:DNA-binding transcriptional LysR family regulator
MSKASKRSKVNAPAIENAASVEAQLPRFAAQLLESPRLRKFITVAEELNFRRAAERLNMSQPPLSAAIKELEELLGAQLLERDKKVVRLTPTGSVFLKEARLALAQVERAVRVAREAEEGFIGRLRIGVSGSLGYGFLPNLLSTFRRDYRQIKLDIFEGTSIEQAEAVRDGLIDVGFVRAPIPDVGELEFRVIHKDRLIVVMPEGHRLAKCETVDLKELAKEEFVVSSGILVPGLRAQIDRVCRAAGFSPNVQCELHSVPTIVSLVSGGMGVALVPGSARVSRHDGVVYKEIHGRTEGLELEVLALWRKGSTSRTMTNFLKIARL